MNLKWILLGVTCLGLLLSTVSGQGQGGVITGQVVDNNGAPLPSAQVTASEIGNRPGGIIPLAETDAKGHFELQHLKWATYRLYAAKPEAGYPNLRFAFYTRNQPTAPTVTLTRGSPLATVTLLVGPKAGVIKGVITDAATGDPVNATIRLERSDAPTLWYARSVQSEYRVLVPATVGISIEVTAEGYRKWVPSREPDAPTRAPISLKSGQELRLDIKLQR